MNNRIIEQQLKKQVWLHNFQDPKLINKLLTAVADILPRGRNLISLTYGNQVRSNGELTEIWWLLLLTDREIFLMETPLEDDKWRGAPKLINFDEIKIINGKRIKDNSQNLRINLVTNNQGWTFETLDLDSGLHFINKTESLIVAGFHDLAAVLKTQEFNDLEIIDLRKKKKKHHKIFNHFFNFNSLWQSVPALQALFLCLQLFWLIGDALFIGLADKQLLTFAWRLALGLSTLFFNLSASGFLLVNLVNKWTKHAISMQSQKLCLFLGMMILLLVSSVLMIFLVPSSLIFAIVGLFCGLYIWETIALDLWKGIKEIDFPISTFENQ